MEAVVADNALELAIIGGLMAIIVAFITIASVAIFRQGSKIDRLGEELVKTNRELSEKIAQSHQELGEKIAQSHRELGEKIAQSHQELSERIAQSHQELSERIAQSYQELSEKIDAKIEQLRNDMTRQMEQTKNEIVAALVNHTHPNPGGPPVFTAPLPARPELPAQNGAPDQAAAEPQPAPADN